MFVLTAPIFLQPVFPTARNQAASPPSSWTGKLESRSPDRSHSVPLFRMLRKRNSHPLGDRQLDLIRFEENADKNQQLASNAPIAFDGGSDSLAPSRSFAEWSGWLLLLSVRVPSKILFACRILPCALPMRLPSCVHDPSVLFSRTLTTEFWSLSKSINKIMLPCDIDLSVSGILDDPACDIESILLPLPWHRHLRLHCMLLDVNFERQGQIVQLDSAEI